MPRGGASRREKGMEPTHLLPGLIGQRRRRRRGEKRRGEKRNGGGAPHCQGSSSDGQGRKAGASARGRRHGGAYCQGSGGSERRSRSSSTDKDGRTDGRTDGRFKGRPEPTGRLPGLGRTGGKAGKGAVGFAPYRGKRKVRLLAGFTPVSR